jgi:hypothetical protein
MRFGAKASVFTQGALRAHVKAEAHDGLNASMASAHAESEAL